MDGQRQAERLAEAVDRVLLEGGQLGPQDLDLAPLLSLGAELQVAMPPLQASPAFQASLRTRLVAQERVPWWRRAAGRLLSASPHPDPLPLGEGVLVPPLPLGEGRAAGWRRASEPSPRRRPWQYAFALAAIAVAMSGASLWLRAPSVSPSPALPAQPGLVARSDAPSAGATTAVAAPSAPIPVAGARNAGPATLEASPGTLLPALPPLGASSPLMRAYGLGGGVAVGAEPTPPAPRLRLELATSMPELPPVATVYRYRQPAADPERLKRLAAQLGFDPADLRPMDDAPEAWVAHDSIVGSLDFQGPGGPVLYHAAVSGPESGGQAAGPLLEDAGAAEVATRWLLELGLLPAEAGPPRVSLPHPRAPFKEVVFRPAQPAVLATPDPQIKVDVDARGRVVSLFLLWPERESVLSYPARTAESAWHLLQSGKAVMALEDHPLPPDWGGSVRVTGVEQGYALTFALDGRPYLQPVVMFRGASAAEGEGILRPFAAQVPLVADSALPPERVNYVLVGSLPSPPVEAAALERGRLLTPLEALEALQMGRGTIEVPSRRGRAIYSDRAEVERVELGYRLRAPEVVAQGPGGRPGGEPTPQRYEPYYRFSGTLELGESRLRAPFTAWLPAWASRNPP